MVTSDAIAAAFEILSFGSVVMLVVLGMGLIASMMGVFNFAQGEFVLLGAYVTWLVHSTGAPVWLGMALAPVAVGLLGLAVEALVVRRLYATPIAAMLATYALGLMLREGVRALIGGQYLAVPAPVDGTVAIAGASLPAWRVVVVVATLVVMAGCAWLVARTPFGLKVRASLENASLARASGISTSRVYAITFAFGAALAGLAGALLVPTFSLYADLGVRFLIQGFVAVMVGGAGSFAGSIAGGAVIGGVSSGLPWVMSPVIADVMVFVLAILFVRVVPRGLVGMFHMKGA
jgi:branched-chain amino acid transport system permease protein